MRRLLKYSASIIALSAPAFADDIDASSQVTAATLYPNSATVTRTAEFSANSGTHSIIISDLPLNFDASSLRVLGGGDSEFTILSVDHRIDRLPPKDDTTSPERQRIEDQIEEIETKIRNLGYERTALEAKMAVADARLRFVEQLMTRKPQDMVDQLEYQNTGLESWADAIDVLAQQTQVALTNRNNAQKDIDTNIRAVQDLQEDRSKAQQSLQALQLPEPQRSIATIELAADQAVSGTLSLEYRVQWAGWEPIYDMRLDQGDNATLDIERHARVFQQTGEKWDDIELTLSTARPSNRIDMPDIQARMAALQTVMTKSGITSRASEMERGKVRSSQLELLEMDEFAVEVLEDAAVLAEPIAASTPVNQIIVEGQTVIYKISGQVDVAGDGTVRQMTIDSGSADVGLLARSTPLYDRNAYLYAAYTNAFAGPILPGQASLFRDGTYIGDFHMPLIAQNEEVSLPFGVVDGIKISRRLDEKEEGDFGIIGTTNRMNERFTITAESLLPYAIPVTIFDRAPFSENEDLEISMNANPKPSETDVDGKRGVMSWTFDLKPNATKKLVFAYELQWPGDQNMIFSDIFHTQ